MRSSKRLAVSAGVVLGLALAAGPAPAAAPTQGALHVPSPDWRDQIIYFLMIDRFDDADPANNDQGAGEYDPKDGAKYSGGDLAGIERRLGYIRGLGATSIWITPPVAHQWWNRATRYGGYHGYWAEDFSRVDAHFGSLHDYRRLSRAIHGAGMYLVQDIVVNHVANYFGYPHGWNAGDPAGGFVLHPVGDGRQAPTRWPFSLNDARNPAHRAAGIYHWTPDISDFADRRQELTFQLAGLDDLDTGNPIVRDALREAYGMWIREAGVDAFRVDTAFYVEPGYFADFLRADDPQAPGVLKVARATGRRDFHVFGEGFGIDKPLEDVQARRIDGYMRANTGSGTQSDGSPLLPGMVNFPLYGTLGDVFARGRPTSELAYRIRNMMQVHANPHLMPTFVDNHDVDRFLAGGSEAGLRQALLAIMTLPGIPTLYYGTEQGLVGQRDAMFAAGVGSGGRSHFDTGSPHYRFLQRAIALRRGHRLFSRGTPTVLADNAAAPGALVYRMAHGAASALVAFNSSERATLLDNLDTGLAAGTVLQGLFAIEGDVPELVAGAGGRISLVLPPRSGFAWNVTAAVRQPSGTPASIRLDPGHPPRVEGDFELQGIAEGARDLRLVIDGDLGSARPVAVGDDGRWRARVETTDMVDSAVTHAAVIWDAQTATASAAHRFGVTRAWTPLADVEDARGDDHGPDGSYAYPTDASWGEHRQADLLGVRAWGSGGALKLELRMHDVTAAWNPANGFDHVAFTLFIELPGRDGGVRAMPLQNASLPDGMRWHYRLRAHGWSNAFFSAEGASATGEGRIATPAAGIAVDPMRDRVTFTLPASALGHPRTLSGARLYITTWDYDGGYRALVPQAQSHAFGGGDGSRDPLVMDSSAVVTLP